MSAPRVLVIRGGAIGDFILTLPAIRLLREGIPGCHLEVMGYPAIAPLAVTAGLADAVRHLGHQEMAPLFAPGAPVAEAVADYLRSFNLVVSYLFDPDGHFRGNLERLGVKTLIECPHRVQPDAGPAAAQLARPLEKLALFLDDPAPWIGERPASAATLAPGVLVLHPGSGSTAKNWPLERWRELLRRVRLARLILITGEAEEARGVLEALRAEAWRETACEHWHGLPLPKLAGRLREQAAAGARFLGHDSGVSHLAAACGLPCLLLFGPTDPRVWAPQNPGVRVVQAPEGDLARLPVEAVASHDIFTNHDALI